jgi:hypothetical protein
MEDLNRANGVRFHDILFDQHGISLLSGQSKLLFIEKKEVQKIVLKHGFQSERPIVQILFGIVLTGLGIYLLVDFILLAIVQRTIYDVGCLSPLLLPVGFWFIVDGFRKRLYFEVSLENDTRKFPLGKNPDKGELQKFIKIASQLGYPVDAKILDKALIN